MRPFCYHRPESLADASRLLTEHLEAKPLAGGQSLLPTLRLRLAAPTDLIDLGGIAALRGIQLRGNELHIGAMTRHCEVAGSPDVVRTIPALAHLAGQIGDRQVRNVGTLGGSLANNDPAACYPAAALGLGATIHTSRRSIPADEFLSGMYETCLAADELIASVSLPIPRGAAYEKFRQPASRFALVGVFIARRQSEVRVAVTGAGLGGVFRVKSMELALTREFDVQSLDGITVDVDGLSGDIHASAEYRAHLITVLARRAVAQIAGAGTL